MIVYITGLLASLLCIHFSKKAKKRHNLAAFISALPLGLISAFRWDVGTDFYAYRMAFESIARGRNYGFEPLFVTISSFAIKIWGNIQGAFFLFAFLTIFLITKFILQNSNNPKLSFTLFFLLGFYFSSMNIIRQYVALSVILFSVKYAYRKNWIKFSLLCLIAAGFHSSAIIAFFFVPICFIKFEKMHYYIIFALSAFLPLFLPLILRIIRFILPQYAYIIQYNIEQLNILEIIYYVSIVGFNLLLGVISFPKIEKTRENIFLFNCIFFCFLCYAFLNRIPLINRAAIYLEFFLILYIPMIVNLFSKKYKRVVTISIVLLYALSFYTTILSRNRFDVFPYNMKFL